MVFLSVKKETKLSATASELAHVKEGDDLQHFRVQKTIFTARYTVVQSAVLRLHVVYPSVRPSFSL